MQAWGHVTDPVFTADTYARWRATPLGEITEQVETALIIGLAGPLKGKRLLDVGTGDGHYAIAAAMRGAEVTALDSALPMLKAARQRSKENGLTLELVQGDAEALPFEDGSFDMVLAVTVLCLIPNAPQAVREMARVLAPGGCLILGELGRYNLWAAKRRVRSWLGESPWRKTRFRSRRELRELAIGAGLQVVAFSGAVHFPPVASLARLLGPMEPLLTRMRAPGAAFLALAASKPESKP